MLPAVVMKRIKLTQGKFTLVDDRDFENLSKFSWYFKRGYALRNSTYARGEPRKTISMSREILLTTSKIVDHVNGDSLDNRRANLRACDHSGNARNKGLQRGRRLPKGVAPIRQSLSSWKRRTSWKKRKEWQARIKIGTKLVYLGAFATIREAALAYNLAASKYFGEFARLNKV
jgi:hypothetical protein